MECKREEKNDTVYIESNKNKVLNNMNLKLKRSQKTVEVISQQNKYLQKQIDELINIDIKDTTYLTETFDEYEQKIKKLEIDNNCLMFQIKAYENLMTNKKCDILKESVTCILCCDQQRNVIFRPCNHILICDDCSGKSNYEECFVCRSKIVDYEYAYLI